MNLKFKSLVTPCQKITGRRINNPEDEELLTTSNFVVTNILTLDGGWGMLITISHGYTSS